MPIPKPRADESESDYMGRCMGSESVQSEFPDREQRIAVCMSTFREGGKSANIMDYECNTMHVAAEIKAEDGDSGTFSGYGSIFGNVDLGQDVVEKGAFSRSIAKRGARGIKLLYQHRMDEPIGIFEEITEDERGLKVKGRLAMGTQRGREAYELMKMGALDGLSIGYRLEPKGYTYDADKGRRYLKEVDLMEISAVTFPMNPRARVSAVKGADWTVRQWEAFLRDAGNLSRSEAKAAAGAVAKALNLRDVEEQEELLHSLKRLQTLMTR